MTAHLQPETATGNTLGELRHRQRLEVLVGAWLAGYRNAGTRRAYRYDLKTWLSFCADHSLDPLAVRRSHVEVFARLHEHAGLAPATISRRLTALSSWYAWAHRRGLRTSEPARPVPPPTCPRPNRIGRGSAGSNSPTGSMPPSTSAANDYALACLAAINALRIGEVCNANIGDLGRDRHHRTLRIIGKGARSSIVPLTARTAFAVDQALGQPTTGPLLITRSGDRLNREAAARAVRRISRAAGITKPLTPHSLRHSAITAALNAGVDLRDVQKFARHLDPATTIRYDRARLTLDRNRAYVVDMHIASGSA